MHEAQLDVVIVLGDDIDKVGLLVADDARNTLPVFLCQHIDVVVRQFVTQNVDAIADTQNRNADRC